jgi:hypothetical protein
VVRYPFLGNVEPRAVTPSLAKSHFTRYQRSQILSGLGQFVFSPLSVIVPKGGRDAWWQWLGHEPIISGAGKFDYTNKNEIETLPDWQRHVEAAN